MWMKLKAFLTLLGPSLREKIIFKNYKYITILWFLKNTFTPLKLSSNRINEFHSTYITWQMISKPQVKCHYRTDLYTSNAITCAQTLFSISISETKYLYCNITFTRCNYTSYTKLKCKGWFIKDMWGSQEQFDQPMYQTARCEKVDINHSVSIFSSMHVCTILSNMQIPSFNFVSEEVRLVQELQMHALDIRNSNIVQIF